MSTATQTRRAPGRVYLFLSLCVLTSVSACSSSPIQRTVTVPVEHTRYVPLPAGLLDPCLIAPQTVDTNASQPDIIDALVTALTDCNSDKQKLRELQHRKLDTPR